MNGWYQSSKAFAGSLVLLGVISTTTFAAQPRWGDEPRREPAPAPTGGKSTAPGGSVPLKLYRHPKFGFVSVAAEESERELKQAGYQFVRVEGYVLAGPAGATAGPPPASLARTISGNERAYLRVIGMRQGPIRGGASGDTDPRHRGDIAIQAVVGGESNTPGAPGQLKVIKQPDVTSPMLSRALQDREPLTTVEIRFAQPDAQGGYLDYETVRLKGATISTIDQRYESGGRVEEVAFSYQCLEREVRQGGSVITSGCDRR